MNRHHSIREANHALEAWIREISSESVVSLEAPGAATEGPTVGLYLFELGDVDGGRAMGRAAARVRLRYLVTAWADAAAQAHGLLEKVLFAALDAAHIDVNLTPVPAALWHSLGVAARPAFVIEAEVVHERERPPVKRVSIQPEVRAVPMVSVSGQVLVPAADGPAVPLAGALVELPSHDRRADTDHEGRFRFAGLPGDQPDLRMRVRARGLVRDYTTGAERAPGEPLTLLFPIPED